MGPRNLGGLGQSDILEIRRRYACLPCREASKDFWKYPTVLGAQNCLVPELIPADCKLKMATEEKKKRPHIERKVIFYHLF